MHIFMFCFGLAVLMLGLYYSLKQRSPHDINQAALLPFADDPDAAARVTKAPSIQFDNIINGTEYEFETIAGNRLDSFIA